MSSKNEQSVFEPLRFYCIFKRDYFELSVLDILTVVNFSDNVAESILL